MNRHLLAATSILLALALTACGTSEIPTNYSGWCTSIDFDDSPPVSQTGTLQVLTGLQNEFGVRAVDGVLSLIYTADEYVEPDRIDAYTYFSTIGDVQHEFQYSYEVFGISDESGIYLDGEREEVITLSDQTKYAGAGGSVMRITVITDPGNTFIISGVKIAGNTTNTSPLGSDECTEGDEPTATATYGVVPTEGGEPTISSAATDTLTPTTTPTQDISRNIFLSPGCVVTLDETNTLNAVGQTSVGGRCEIPPVENAVLIGALILPADIKETRGDNYRFANTITDDSILIRPANTGIGSQCFLSSIVGNSSQDSICQSIVGENVGWISSSVNVDYYLTATENTITHLTVGAEQDGDDGCTSPDSSTCNAYLDTRRIQNFIWYGIPPEPTETPTATATVEHGGNGGNGTICIMPGATTTPTPTLEAGETQDPNATPSNPLPACTTTPMPSATLDPGIFYMGIYDFADWHSNTVYINKLSGSFYVPGLSIDDGTTVEVMDTLVCSVDEPCSISYRIYGTGLKLTMLSRSNAGDVTVSINGINSNINLAMPGQSAFMPNVSTYNLERGLYTVTITEDSPGNFLALSFEVLDDTGVVTTVTPSPGPTIPTPYPTYTPGPGQGGNYSTAVPLTYTPQPGDDFGSGGTAMPGGPPNGGISEGVPDAVGSVRGIWGDGWNWIQLGINTPRTLVDVWYNTTPTAPQGLPDCTDISGGSDVGTNICAVYYILEWTLFAGIGVAIMPMLAAVVDLMILLSVLDYVKTFIRWLMRLFQ